MACTGNSGRWHDASRTRAINLVITMVKKKLRRFVLLCPPWAVSGDPPNPSFTSLPSSPLHRHRLRPPSKARAVPTALPLSMSSEGRRGALPVGGGALRSRLFQRRRRLARVVAPGDKVARTPPLGGGMVQWPVAAPSQPRSRPFRPHLGLDGLGLGMAIPPPAAGGVAWAGGGLDGGMPTIAWRWELHEPVGLAGKGGLVCSC
jgi:hypothetical protein